MRITGGNARGIPLRLPARGEIRPATDYLREAVFSSLGAFVADARVLDLFSGTGAYGLESLSRGARHVTFVEKNPAALAALRANAAAVHKALRSATTAAAPPPDLPCVFCQHDALRWEPPPGETYDLIFCDPPWLLWQGAAAALPARIAAWACPGPDSRIILEAPGDWRPAALPDGWREHRHLAKGRAQPAALILRPVPPAM